MRVLKIVISKRVLTNQGPKTLKTSVFYGPKILLLFLDNSSLSPHILQDEGKCTKGITFFEQIQLIDFKPVINEIIESFLIQFIN